MPPAETAPRGTRYDAQAAVLGWTKQAQIGDLRYLLVGAGAIGCEVRAPPLRANGWLRDAPPWQSCGVCALPFRDNGGS